MPPRQRKRAVRVRHHHGVIIAVRIQVETVQLRERFIQHAHIIRRDESARFGVVITAVQIVEARLFVVVVPAITERVDRQNIRATLREDVTPCVVLVFAEQIPARIIDADDIALQVLAVIVLLTRIFKARYAVLIVIVMDDRAAALLGKDLIPLDEIVRRALRNTDPAVIVCVGARLRPRIILEFLK